MLEFHKLSAALRSPPSSVFTTVGNAGVQFANAVSETSAPERVLIERNLLLGNRSIDVSTQPSVSDRQSFIEDTVVSCTQQCGSKSLGRGIFDKTKKEQ